MFEIDAETKAIAEADGKYNTALYWYSDPHPGKWDMVQTHNKDFLKVQPDFSWESRPTYGDGNKIQDGDLIVLAITINNVLRQEYAEKWYEWANGAHFAEEFEYNGGHYLICPRRCERKKAAHFQVRKVGDRVNLIHVESGNALNRQGVWVGVHPDDDKDPKGRNVGFYKYMWYFESSGNQVLCSTNSAGEDHVNADNRGHYVAMWPVKVRDWRKLAAMSGGPDL